jgi:AraC-like DNA-binding protein
MQLGTGDDLPIAPHPAVASAVAGVFVREFQRDTSGVVIPRAESHLVVRFGPAARRGLDVYAFGAQQRARRKLIHGGQRSLMARLHLGTHEAVLGVPAAAIAGRVIALEELWGNATTERLVQQLAAARSTAEAAAVLEAAIAARYVAASGRRGRTELALAAAARLQTDNVNAVAVELGVSERHLRRVFHEAVGVNPKAFANLARFHRALRAACKARRANWSGIAAAAGYYDQAHLIAEFKVIAGATPQGLLSELRAAGSDL